MKNEARGDYNLEERTLIFSQELVLFINSLTKTFTNKVLLHQLLRSGTSIGANYPNNRIVSGNTSDSSAEQINFIGISPTTFEAGIYFISIIFTNITSGSGPWDVQGHNQDSANSCGYEANTTLDRFLSIMGYVEGTTVSEDPAQPLMTRINENPMALFYRVDSTPAS